MKAIVEVATEIFHNHETKKHTQEVISPLPVISLYSTNYIKNSVCLKWSICLDGERFVTAHDQYDPPKNITIINRSNANTVEHDLAVVVSCLLCER